MVRFLSLVGAAAAMAVTCAAVAGSNPWADSVVSYVQGANADSDHNVAANALGSPERITGEDSPFGSFPGNVTPFAAAFGFDEFVSIGAGGSLIVSFAQPVTNDPLNPFGVDLLVFSNAFFSEMKAGAGVAAGLVSEGGTISISADGTNWTVVPN
ncbi:MAG: hypothetical protein ACK46I_06630, partial [Phycisphaerae bacterium]